MFVRVWEYEVAEGKEQEFERVYGPDGDWARLFAQSDGFVGTELFRSVRGSLTYLTVDRFTSPNAWRQFLTQHGPTYAGLDHTYEHLTLSEREIATGDHA